MKTQYITTNVKDAGELFHKAIAYLNGPEPKAKDLCDYCNWHFHP